METACLGEVVSETLGRLKAASPRRVDRVDNFKLPPTLPKPEWDKLADAIRNVEHSTSGSIPGDKWISLRLDGKGFSKMMKKFRSNGVFDHGWSPEFADIMKTCLRNLMDEMGACCGSTHSDEMTLLIKPTVVREGCREPRQPAHRFNGRVMKMCSTAAAVVSSRFNYKIMELCKSKNITYDAEYLASFDCRVGAFATQDEAVSLLLWRSHDCAFNALSEMVHHSKGKVDGAGATKKLGSHDKVRWLTANNLLPMHPSQQDGIYLVSWKRVLSSINRHTGKEVQYVRSRVGQLQGNLIELWQNDKLFPEDEMMLNSDTQ